MLMDPTVESLSGFCSISTMQFPNRYATQGLNYIQNLTASLGIVMFVIKGCEPQMPIGSKLGLGLMQQPGQQIDLGRDGHGLDHALIVFLRDNSSAVPLEESVKRAKRRLSRDFDKLATLLSLGSLVILVGARSELLDAEFGQITGVGNDLGELGEVEHHVRNGRLASGAAVGDVAEDVSEGDEADETLARGCEDRELVEALVSHHFDGSVAWSVGEDRGDGLESQRLHLCTTKRILGSTGSKFWRRGCDRGSLGEEIIGSKPVIVRKLFAMLAWLGERQATMVHTLVR